MKRTVKTTLHYNGDVQILEDILFNPFEKMQCIFGHFSKWESFDAISESGHKIQRHIRLLKEDINPIAYEFYNYETGHSYVDYVERDGMKEKDGYTKMPLFRRRL